MIGAGARFATLALIGLGCGGKPGPRPTVARDAGDAGVVADATATSDAAAARAGTAAGYRVIDTAGAPALAITVEWPTASAAARRSPGRTACGNARPPRARVATLHGVAGAIVVLDVTAGKAPPVDAPLRVQVRDCAVTPTVALASGVGTTLEVQSADERAPTVAVVGLGPAWDGVAATATAMARARLPMIGHTVAIAQPSAGAVRIEIEGEAADDGAIVVVPPHPYVAITDEAGVARWLEVPPGTYAAQVWLPGRAGAPPVTASTTVTVGTDDATAKVVLAP